MTEPALRPTVLYVCVHNAGRSQMAAAFTELLAGDLVDVRSAGSEPANAINAKVVAAMAELGIDLRARQPKLLSDDDVRDADAVVTMGCNDACPVFAGKRYIDWVVEDPAGQDLEAVRRIRDEIGKRVSGLLVELLTVYR